MADAASTRGGDAPPGTEAGSPRFEHCVYVNCPFDDEFLPLLHAILFAIHDCGFVARIAVEDEGSNETRLDKIVRLIRDSRLSIHDISRVELTVHGALPRFNMPFECGLALGAIRYGEPRGRDFLFMSALPGQDRETLSNLGGQDPAVHHNEPRAAIEAVRSFLAAKNGHAVRTPGVQAIWERYQAFGATLPKLALEWEIAPREIESFKYLRDWLAMMPEWLKHMRGR